MRDFEYARPTTLADALNLIATHNGQSRLLAGGTDLIDHIRMERLTPDWVIDIKSVPELNRLEADDTGFHLGAAVPCWRIKQDETICNSYSALADSCRIIGGIQIQNRASVGGNLCNSGPAADSTPSLIALNATCVIDGVHGRREVAVEEFCTGPGKNVLDPGEILLELRFPTALPWSGSHYRRFIPRNEMDIASVSVGAWVQLNESGERFEAVRVAMGAVAPTPLYVPEISDELAGQSVSEETIQRAAVLATAAAQPIDDMRGTVEFRKHVSGVLTRRVLTEAVERARTGQVQFHVPG
ncbi:FAD binding domain-containing protein [Thalassoroseus pseudoceratinae]|uniref:FAD binding domain-containing protein n=1 Tax=Thalassoroseus pseudoceratinae TaxID=2713176 RepID=UPI001422C39A|nr:xanthine dehydrogenase family protein subunit M [Thalassoroseus pseudoceratinae]